MFLKNVNLLWFGLECLELFHFGARRRRAGFQSTDCTTVAESIPLDVTTIVLLWIG